MSKMKILLWKFMSIKYVSQNHHPYNPFSGLAQSAFAPITDSAGGAIAPDTYLYRGICISSYRVMALAW